MKILHFVGSFINGGIETLLVNLSNEQVASGNEVTILIGTSKISEDMIATLDKRVKVFRTNKPVGSKNPLYFLKTLFFYKRYKADILHLHRIGKEFLFLPKNKGERRIVSIHNETIKMKRHKSTDYYIAISQCVKDSFNRQIGLDNIRVCYNGVQTNKIIRKEEYSDKPYRVVVLGRILFNVKAQDLIVKAISKLPDSIKSKMTFDFWGDGLELPILRKLVANLGLENINFCGNVSNDYVFENLHKYDLMLLASHHEGLGISAIEAMAAGVPVLLSDALGFVEVTENGKYGKLFKHSEIDALTSALKDTYDNYNLSIEKAKSALSYSIEKFSMENYSNNIMNIYLDKLYD